MGSTLTTREMYNRVLSEFSRASLAVALVPRSDTRERYRRAARELAEWVVAHKDIITVEDVEYPYKRGSE